ncbi:MAG: hypothetical protein JO141_17255 [Bradyrhizobium sp.]|nr:hypothetical protein [Bradyrhizobium sp.]
MNELVRRIAVTIGALLFFRPGSHIPLRGSSLQSDLLASRGINRISIFALVLTPYISAAILIRLLSVVWGKLSALERSGEAGRRKYPALQVGKRLFAPRDSVLPIKINCAGFLIPVTVMPWVFFVPPALATFIFGRTPWLASAYDHMQFGRPAHIILGAIVVFVLAFIYAAYVLDPERAAETLQKQGGAFPGVEPGEASADYLGRIVSLTTAVGAVYLVIVSLIPEALVAGGVALPYKIGGGSALIVVCTILDLKRQVRALSPTDPGGVRQ